MGPVLLLNDATRLAEVSGVGRCLMVSNTHACWPLVVGSNNIDVLKLPSLEVLVSDQILLD